MVGVQEFCGRRAGIVPPNPLVANGSSSFGQRLVLGPVLEQEGPMRAAMVRGLWREVSVIGALTLALAAPSWSSNEGWVFFWDRKVRDLGFFGSQKFMYGSGIVIL